MPVVIGFKDRYEFRGTDLENNPCLFPRDMRNFVCAQAFDFSTKVIAEDPAKYLAFPQAMMLSGSIVGIYSDGNSHAASDRQIMFRSDDLGKTYRFATFFENSTGVYDFSLLLDLIPPGGSQVFKVWTVRNIAGVFSAVVNSTVAYGGLNYAQWSPVRAGADGLFYRTGYAPTGGNIQSAVFVSSDKVTWTGKSISFAGSGLLLSESDIVETSSGNWLSVCREDSGAGNPLYRAISTDNMATWSAATAFTTTNINGRQPNLTKLSDGSIILATGDRSGSSGYGGSAGDQVTGFDTTGITVFRTTDPTGAEANWSYRTRVAPIYSTDGSQPATVEISPGRINVIHYARRATRQTPGIGSSLLNVANL
ncbi:exo-alpha-sialidase [Achromobacter sp. LC458]|uniref:sialidase family protein n=1 Tax=Achromobacter sp. LC458 TaxID=1120623 RepID=UPI00062A3FBC|nr:sialidase family protein [Achromobacter sp. LC458]TRM53272.1 exo-alpha-sialidase [Achromobacter sp. LC458]